MSTATMVEGPKGQFNKETVSGTNGQEAAPQKVDKKRLKDAFKKGAFKNVPSGLNVIPEIKPKAEATVRREPPPALAVIKPDELEAELRAARTMKEAKELYDTFGEGVINREDFARIMKEWQKARVQAVSGQDAALGDTAHPEEPKESAITSSDVKRTGETEKTGEVDSGGATPSAVETTEETPVSQERPVYKSLDELEEAFGNGDIDRDEFLRRRGLLQPSTPEVAEQPKTVIEEPVAGKSNLVGLIEEQIKEREKYSRQRFIEEELQRKQQGRGSKSRRPQKEETESHSYQKPEFPPSEEMTALKQEISVLTDQAKAKWERVIVYKKPDARTLKSLSELEELFRKREVLKNLLKSAENRARNAFEEVKKVEKAGSKAEAGSRTFGVTPGYKATSTLGEILGFRGKSAKDKITELDKMYEEADRRKQEEKIAKRAKEAGRKEQKERDKVNDRPTFADYLEDLSIKFGEGTIDREEFTSKLYTLEKIRKAKDTQAALDEAFGEGIFSREEYLKLRPLVEIQAKADKSAETQHTAPSYSSLEDLEEAFGRGDISRDEFLVRKRELKL